MSIRWLLAVCLSVSVCAFAVDSIAGTRLTKSASYDWVGWLEESKLPDNSILFEYAARTLSGSTEGAMLTVSFVPRFNCNMAISIHIPRAVLGDDMTESIELLIDDELYTFDSVREEDGDSTVFSLVTTNAEIEELLETINLALRANIRPVTNTEGDRSSSTQDGPDEESLQERAATIGSSGVNFSLLGSRISTEGARLQCTLHKPVGYSPQ